MERLRIREAARAIVFDDRHRLLLVRFPRPEGDLWVMPGGGLDDNETATEAIIRELREEAGLQHLQLGPVVWTRTVLSRAWEGYDGQRERYILVRTTDSDARPTLSADQLVVENISELRWWAADELRDEDQAGTRFAPRRLLKLVNALVTNGPPNQPLDISE